MTPEGFVWAGALAGAGPAAPEAETMAIQIELHEIRKVRMVMNLFLKLRVVFDERSDIHLKIQFLRLLRCGVQIKTEIHHSQMGKMIFKFGQESTEIVEIGSSLDAERGLFIGK